MEGLPEDCYEFFEVVETMVLFFLTLKRGQEVLTVDDIIFCDAGALSAAAFGVFVTYLASLLGTLIITGFPVSGPASFGVIDPDDRLMRL